MNMPVSPQRLLPGVTEPQNGVLHGIPSLRQEEHGSTATFSSTSPVLSHRVLTHQRGTLAHVPQGYLLALPTYYGRGVKSSCKPPG